MMGLLDPFLSSSKEFYVRNIVLLYNQLIRPMIYYACRAWKGSVRTHVRRLQLL
jgi:hypothetical protein